MKYSNARAIYSGFVCILLMLSHEILNRFFGFEQIKQYVLMLPREFEESVTQDPILYK
jgi:hypothetical protein